MRNLFYFRQKILIRISLLVPLSMLCIISLLILNKTDGGSSEIFGFLLSRFDKQCLWILLGSLVLIGSQFIRIRFFHEYIHLFYLLLLLILIYALFQDSVRVGAIEAFGFQPSEFGKIVLVIILSKYLSDNKNDINNIKTILIAIAFVAAPISLILIAGDLGTAIVYISILIPMLYWIGLDTIYLSIFFFPVISLFIKLGLIFSPYALVFKVIFILWIILNIFFLTNEFFKSFSPSVLVAIVSIILSNLFVFTYGPDLLFDGFADREGLSEEQKGRIETFFDTSKDQKGEAYQVNQSLIAVGSGGFWGKGLGEGTQSQYGFLPEAGTDFIVSVIAEELGFFFIIIIICCYIFIFYWLFVYAQIARQPFSSLIIVGFITVFMIHILFGMGMGVGLLPITGLPTPFLSYGGTFILTCFFIVGLCNNISNN